MKRLPTPRLVTVAAFTTITVIFWVFYGVYTVLTKKADININPDLLKPIDPKLETETLKTLEEKIFYEEEYTPTAQNQAQTPNP